MIPRQYNYDQDLKKHQIDTLKIFNDNVQEVKEYEEYVVTFQSGGRLFKLTTYLGNHFPHDKPKIVINPPIKHFWCNNNNGEIDNAPGLLNFTIHSDLGRVVQAIIREYEKFPPPLILLNEINNCDINNSNNSKDNNNSIITTTSYDQSTLQLSSNKSLSSNRINYNIPELTKLSLDDLKKLDTDPDFFNDFIEEMSIVQTLNNELDSIIRQVEEISKDNQSKEGYLTDLKAKISTDIHTLKEVGERCEKLNEKYKKQSDELTPQHIKELLQIAASNADTVCEKFVEQFLNNKMNVQTFLNCYTQSKKLSAIRKAKEERLAHQLKELERSTI